MPVRISIKIDAKQLQRQLSNLAQRQVPFAISQAINAVAAKVIEAQTAAISTTFDKPRAFTQKAFTQGSSFGGQFASKRNPVAIIVAKPIQEAYLVPSEFDERQSLGQGKRIRTPVNAKTNAGGNLSQGQVAKLLAQPDVFMGVVNGVNGLWQRPSPPRTKGGPRRSAKANTTGRLKLLVAFTRPVKVKTKLHFRERATQVVQRHFNAEFDRALGRALATAR